MLYGHDGEDVRGEQESEEEEKVVIYNAVSCR